MLQLNPLDSDVCDCAAAQALFDVATQVRFFNPVICFVSTPSCARCVDIAPARSRTTLHFSTTSFRPHLPMVIFDRSHLVEDWHDVDLNEEESTLIGLIMSQYADACFQRSLHAFVVWQLSRALIYSMSYV